jgi:AcrR family transcriptional regulator
MSIQDRREIEKEKFVELVIDAATKILEEESMDAISIRKIASKIDYSPSLIYHYFKDKNSIIDHILIRKYQLMNQKLRTSSGQESDPIMKFRNTLRAFITFSLENKKDFFEVMSSNQSEILNHTRVLFKGVSDLKPGFGMMRNHIMALTHFDQDQAEIIAQIIWSSTFGLIMRIHIESVEEHHKNILIDHHIKYHVDQLLNIRKKE